MASNNNESNNNIEKNLMSTSNSIKDFKKEYEKSSSIILEKDDEIKKLKRELEESKKIALTKSNIDIRQKVNKTGDIARICIGINEAGNRVWKKATELTEADIERRNRYIAEIKQRNAKKY